MDPDKLMKALSRIINTMKDLPRLTSEHGIKTRLYSGNGIERIYKWLGDNRVINGSTMCGKSYDDETLWTKLIDFLEKV